MIQSLLGTAKLNGLDPAVWLKDTLEKAGTAASQGASELRKRHEQLDADNSFVLSPDAFAQEDDIRRQVAKGLH